MAKFQLSRQILPGFEAISKLTNGDIAELSEVCRNVFVGASPSTFIKQVRALSHIDGINRIATTLFGLVGILATDDSREEELASDLADSYNDSRLEAELQEEDLRRLKANLLILFSSLANQRLTFKAHTLLTDNENIYQNAKFLSDIRLVFDDDIQEIKRNAVVIHQLKLSYKIGDNDKDFFISLDSLDLIKLKSQIERAIEKERLIKHDYSDKITFIELE